MKLFKILFPTLFLFLFSQCGERETCHLEIGITNFRIEPNSATYSRLNNVGGFEYFTGGHRGVVVIRTAYNEFVAYERTCPCDDNSAVEVDPEWGSAILVCPTCGSRFNVYDYGQPIEGSFTHCPLHQYSTTYDGVQLWVY